MRKLFFLSILILFLAESQAQLSLGIKGGYTKAWEDYGDIGLPDDAPIEVHRFNVSALAYWQLNQYFSVGLEPGYIQRGAACYPGFIVFNGDVKYLLDYVEMPAMFKAELPLFNKKLSLFAKIGAGTSLLVKAKGQRIDFEGDVVVEEWPIGVGNSSLLRRWDLGAYGGTGIAFHLGRGKVFLEVDYYHAIKNAERLNRSQNRNYNFDIGYQINL